MCIRDSREGDAADHHGAHDGQFVAVAGAGVDVAEPGQVHRAGESGERSAEGVRGQDALADRDAGEPGGLRIGTEGVQLPPAAVVLEVVARRHEHHQRDHGEPGDRGDAAGAEVDEAAGQVGRGDLAGADPDGVDAPDDVQGAERDDEGGDLAEAHEEAVEQPEADAQQDGEEDRDDRVPAALQIGSGGEGADAERGADGQVDVAAEDHQ